jgi:lipopolysaccharide transport system ATP-binding protein
MSQIVLKAESLSKYYRLGTWGTGSFKRDFFRLLQPAQQDTASGIWALKDVHFEVHAGDVVGFVGKNGAGKSTLLKILSRISLPTKGSIKGNGRIASLREVGTGFHGDLTGRENIFLNGQILGLNAKQVKDRFDAIVDFSGVPENFLDTPVKRYSSGMYVRLAFAVAAHLDPDILIVDEVLAVGDTEFQKKCLAKMNSIARDEGKTILFVSHNLQTIRNLCSKALCFHKGKLVDEGDPDNVINNYLKREQVQYLEQSYSSPNQAPGNHLFRVARVAIIPAFNAGQQVIDTNTSLDIQFGAWYMPEVKTDVHAAIQLFTLDGVCVFELLSNTTEAAQSLITGTCTIPKHFLNDGSYYLSIHWYANQQLAYTFEACVSFDVTDTGAAPEWFGKWMGYVHPAFPLVIENQPLR